jgi:threonylcarbamoyladenosine tRNA methylthiotransferase MtaB
MFKKDFFAILNSINKSTKTFLYVNFGCRVNSAEIHQLSQLLVDRGFVPLKIKDKTSPDVIIINTCSITKKGDIESLSRVRILQKQNPKALLLVTGCANLKKVSELRNVSIFDNKTKEKILQKSDSGYTPEIKDKFSHTHRFVLKVQSGCTQFCSYCIVPIKRPYLWSLEIDKAVKTVNKAIENGYKEVIITGVNLNQYKYVFSNLVEALLKETKIPLISFGSVPINCIDEKFIRLFLAHKTRLSSFLHIPIQSGSNRILKLMNRPYNSLDISNKFNKLKEIKTVKLEFGTDIIVGFPGESDQDFNDTLNICQKIGFKKIHCFKYSSRPGTLAKTYYESQPVIKKDILTNRSQKIRKLISTN